MTRLIALLAILAFAAGCEARCRESVEIISGMDSAKRCDVGARLEVTPFGVLQAIAKCTCGPAQPDGGR